MIKYASQKITKKDINSVVSSLKSKFITQGSLTLKFENKISKLVNSKYCLSLNSASSALLLACQSLGLKKGDIGWTTTNTFAATANSILLCGAELDLLDIDQKTFNISVPKLREKLKKTKKSKLPKVIIVVHYAGYPCDMKEIYLLSKIYKFKIIEDASHAFGSRYLNNNIGNSKYSDITVFSFHAIKIITTCEGGAITTNDFSIYKKIKLMRTNGITRDKLNNIKSKNKWYYEQKTLGYNFRINEIQAALGISQISNLKTWIKRRNEIAIFYRKQLRNLPFQFQEIKTYSLSTFHLFTIIINKKNLRDRLYKYLKKKKIETNVVYIPLYRHPFYKNKFKFSNFPNSEKFYKNCLSIPIHMDLSNKDLKFIVNSINKFFNNINMQCIKKY